VGTVAAKQSRRLPSGMIVTDVRFSIAQSALRRWNAVSVGIDQDHSFFGVRNPTVTGDLYRPASGTAHRD
jgi:hypothetical protein